MDLPRLRQPESRAYLWPALLALAIVCASGTRRLATPDVGLSFSPDKLAHFLVFGLLATALARTPACRRKGGAVLAAAATALFGGFDELRQSLTPGRMVELADWLADTAGAILAVAVYTRWAGYRRLLEWRPARRSTPHAKCPGAETNGTRGAG